VQAPRRRKELLDVAEQWLRLAERTEQLGLIAENKPPDARS
jgi:hypothetical protein